MLTIRIIDTERAAPPDKLADAELTFTAGVLHGLKLIGFSIWRRRSGAGYNVTFPARQYTVNGERRSFALLRPTGQHPNPDEPLKAAIIAAYEQHAGIAQAPAQAATPAPQPTPAQVHAATNAIGAVLTGEDAHARAEAFPMLPLLAQADAPALPSLGAKNSACQTHGHRYTPDGAYCQSQRDATPIPVNDETDYL